MANSQFTDLDQMKRMMESFREKCETEMKDSLAGMGALEPIVTAIIRLAEEVEALKRKLERQ